MPVLKADHAESAAKSAIVLDLGDIGRQAQKIREQAQAEADRILADAQAQADVLIAAAHDQGFAQGKDEGFAQGRAEGAEQGRTEALAQASEEFSAIQSAWIEAAQHFEQSRAQMDADARQTVLRFAVRLAEKLVHRIARTDDTVILDQLSHALSYVLRPIEVTVHIHPDDRATLEAAMDQLLAQFDHLQCLHLQDDDQLTPGGCVVTFGQGRIDATIETQLSRIVALMVPGGEQVDPAPSAADDQPPGDPAPS